MSDAARPLRVLVVARQALVRAGLRGLLADSAEAVVVGQAASAEEAARLGAELGADVALAAWEDAGADAVLAVAEGLGAGRTPLVVLGNPPPGVELWALARAGVHGLLPGDADAVQVAAAARAARVGLVALDPLVERSLSAAVPRIAPGGEEPLTERELQVLQLLAAGLPNKAIAQRLGISEHTVKFHVGSILAKLDAGSRTEAVTRAARRGWLLL